MTDVNVAQPAADRPPSVLDELERRGAVAQTTGAPALAAALAAGPVTFYCGFDPTAPSLHIGNLVQLLTMRRIQQAGHRPLVLVGGATGLIGDPKMSGERVLNSPDVVAGWVERIRDQVERYLDFDGPYAARMVNNLDWTGDLDRDRLPARHRQALPDGPDAGQGNRLGPAEQRRGAVLHRVQLPDPAGHGLPRAVPAVRLHAADRRQRPVGQPDQRHRADPQGRGRRRARLSPRPLITKADGTKFGKTEGGAVWLDPEMTSPYAFYQFWFNTDDRDVDGYLKVFCRSAVEAELDELAVATRERSHAREAQRALAGEVTALVHGQQAADAAVAASAALFGRGELAAIDEPTLHAALAEAGLSTVDGSGAVGGRAAAAVRA